MYKKIIVPLDGSKLAEQVLPIARLLAGAFDAGVELVQVVGGAAPVREDVLSYLKQAAHRYSLAEERVSPVAESGEAAEIIVDRAKGDRFALIAMATHGLSGPRRWLMGSVAAKVVETAANPLLLIRPRPENPAPAEFNTVFLPLDGSSLAEKALAHAIALARALKLEVHLVRVYALPPQAYVVADGIIARGPADFRDSIRGEAEKYLEGKIDELRAAGIERAIATAIDGDAAGELIDLARRTPKSLIAMTTHGRTGAGRWLVGSVAEKVVHYSQEPVLLLRAG